MKKLFTTLLSTSLIALLTACGSGGGGAAAVPETPEGEAFAYRRALMQSIAYKVAQARTMAEGSSGDAVAFTKHLTDVAALAGMITEGFIPNSAVAGSAALPEIWTNMSDFQQKAADLQNAALALAATSSTQGFDAAKGSIQSVSQTCGGCHRPYRRRQE